MGMTFISMTSDPFGYFFNPAVLGKACTIDAGVYHTNLFGLKELSSTTGAISLPILIGSMGFGGQSFGNPLYYETTFHCGWGLNVFPSFYIGFLGNIGQLKIMGYGSVTTFWTNTGLIYTFSENIVFGFSVININQARIGQTKIPLPQTTHIEIGYQPKKYVLCNFALNKDVRYPLEVRIGLEVCPLPFFMLRCGFTDAPQRITFGMGIQFSRLQIDYAIVDHPILNLTHHVSLIVIIKPKQPSI
ncbi:hypothetical protein ACFL4L_01495 [bacterium]